MILDQDTVQTMRSGNPIYAADKITVLDKPAVAGKIAQGVYLDGSDTLVVAEEGRDEAGKPRMRHIGRVFVCQGYRAGKCLIDRWRP